MNTNTLPKSTESLLRAPLPDADARPGLETRLLAGIQEAPAPSAFPLRLVLAGFCTIIVLVTLATSALNPGSPPPLTTSDPAPERPVLEITTLPNPLETEATALRSSATRAGRFLVSCLPSIPEEEDQL